MILRTGVDLIEIDRVGEVVGRHGRRYLERIYTPAELTQSLNNTEYLAGRFAAKEAVWKALSDTIARKKTVVTHKDIGLKNEPSGKPVVILSGALRRYSKRVLVSLSHTGRTVVAVAIFKG